MNKEFGRIRPAAACDMETMIGLLQQLFLIEEDFTFDADRQRRGLELLLETDRSAIMVCEQAGQVIGMVSGQLVVSTVEGGFSLLIEDVVVRETWQKRGIGRELIRAIGDWAGTYGARRMQLLADRNNRTGLAFYHNGGWCSTNLVCLRKYNRRQKNDPDSD